MKIFGYTAMTLGFLIAFYGIGKLAKAQRSEIEFGDPDQKVALSANKSELSTQEALGFAGLGFSSTGIGMGAIWVAGRKSQSKKKKKKQSKDQD
jgi:hypothetical protein